MPVAEKVSILVVKRQTIMDIITVDSYILYEDKLLLSLIYKAESLDTRLKAWTIQ